MTAVAQRDVTDFIVIAPPAQRAQLLAQRDRFEAWMRAEFPGYAFSVVEAGPAIEDPDTMFVVPIMGTAGNKGDEIQMRRKPDAQLVRDILQRLAAFDLQGRSLN